MIWVELLHVCVNFLLLCPTVVFEHTCNTYILAVVVLLCVICAFFWLIPVY